MDPSLQKLPYTNGFPRYRTFQNLSSFRWLCLRPRLAIRRDSLTDTGEEMLPRTTTWAKNPSKSASG